jgi:hypothetical protein
VSRHRWTRRTSLWLRAAVVAALLVVPAAYVVPPLVQGEHLYHGLPSRHWAKAVRRWDGEGMLGVHWGWDWFDSLMQWLGLTGEPAVLAGDPAAVPVLIDLLQASDEPVRLFAVRGIGRVGREAMAAVPALLDAWDDPSVRVQKELGAALDRAAPSSEELLPQVLRLTQEGKWRTALEVGSYWCNAPGAFPVLVEAAGHPDPVVRQRAALFLAVSTSNGGAGLEKVKPLLAQATRDKDERVRRSALGALKMIEEAARRP